ncbi:hypothetical protein DSO57_1020367 [Entomophthora muscae]|uniref:Uncharacterized protein n=1 Tax=Entomophthora muscae TaxID=34485 RepID=A0ACC2TF36_9FUNG|nr:hypothetical protein DSO57_1020367 [Entomophthora muscae]
MPELERQKPFAEEEPKSPYLPCYSVTSTTTCLPSSHEPPLTLQPDHPQESVATNESTFIRIFGVIYIALTGLIDSMVPASRPWALLGKLLSYIVKLAPILWWALPSGPAGRLPVSSQEPPQAGSLKLLAPVFDNWAAAAV